MSADAVLLHITTANREEAITISRELLSERLIACANILEHVTSLYWWQGQIEHTPEVVIIAKTTANLVEAATARIKSLHRYSCPCIVSMKIDGGNPDFLEWIERETRNKAS
jgi:periplasmic divalent cation tolerance protein